MYVLLLVYHTAKSRACCLKNSLRRICNYQAAGKSKTPYRRFNSTIRKTTALCLPFVRFLVAQRPDSEKILEAPSRALEAAVVARVVCFALEAAVGAVGAEFATVVRGRLAPIVQPKADFCWHAGPHIRVSEHRW